MIEQKDSEKLSKSLLKKALGYTVDEVVEEYVSEGEGDGMKLVKKKITKKHIPPDISAVKTLLESFGEEDTPLNEKTDEELLQMREAIIAEIAKGGKL